MQDYDTDQRTVGHVLADKAETCGDRVFLECGQASFTYAQVDEMTNRYANGFAELGVTKGSHVAVLLANTPAYFWTLWGLGKLGAVAVPLNTAAKGDLLEYFLRQSESTMVCVSPDLAPQVAPALSRAEAVQHLLVAGGEPPDSSLLPGTVRISSLDALAASSAASPRLAEPVRAGDPHVILYTSGTTGPSKGVVSPHSQGFAIGRQLTSVNGYGADDVLYTCLPAFHANALWYTVYAALWAEARAVVAPQFSAHRFWSEVRQAGVTVFNCLGAMANILWQQPPKPDDQRHRVRLCMMVPTTASLAAGFKERYGIQVTSVYAMTENCAVSILSPDDPPEKASSAGRVRDYVSVEIADDNGRPLPVGEVGEILVRPNERGIIMLGYYNMAEATAQATRDLWLHTDDRGRLDSDGYLYFVERQKEAIRRRGENVSAYEVEMIICGHPCVIEAAAVPVPSELSEDDVMAYIVTTPGAEVTYERLIDYCVEHMPYYMVPRYLQFVDELPKTPSQKIEKYKLKTDAAANRLRLWDREAHGITVRR